MGILQDFPHVKNVEPYPSFRLAGGKIVQMSVIIILNCVV